MPLLEDEIARLNEVINEVASDYEKLKEATDKRDQIEEELEIVTMRWMELEENRKVYLRMKQKFFKKPLNVVLIAIFCTALWGSAAPFIKTGYALFDIASNDTASILVFAGLRFTLAGVLVIVAGSKIQNKILLPVKKA